MKLTEKEKNNIKLAITTFCYVCFIMFIIWFAAALTACSRQSVSANTVEGQEAEIFMLRCKTANQAAIIKAYEDVLHEVWLDKPSYVEDVLVESDAFDDLFSIEGDSVNINCFRYRNKMDSVRYENSCRTW